MVSRSQRLHTYIVVHKGGSLGEDSCVVREGGRIDIGTVLFDMRAVVYDPAFMINVLDSPEPVPGIFGVLGICIVVCVPSKSGSKVEEASVGNG